MQFDTHDPRGLIPRVAKALWENGTQWVPHPYEIGSISCEHYFGELLGDMYFDLELPDEMNYLGFDRQECEWFYPSLETLAMARFHALLDYMYRRYVFPKIVEHYSTITL